MSAKTFQVILGGTDDLCLADGAIEPSEVPVMILGRVIGNAQVTQDGQRMVADVRLAEHYDLVGGQEQYNFSFSIKNYDVNLHDDVEITKADVVSVDVHQNPKGE